MVSTQMLTLITNKKDITFMAIFTFRLSDTNNICVKSQSITTFAGY